MDTFCCDTSLQRVVFVISLKLQKKAGLSHFARLISGIICSQAHTYEYVKANQFVLDYIYREDGI